ncbi:hypothetical protein [Tenuibacillus multivorans]|uniref:hypothetical protein n=1 Tax=Tenuibacillus multivorans TaxID=237069 RepID=UPI000B80E4E3|nr:hypothetical protein [Tenuibacillus multivorans]GEL78507.1 hypothetical protein TMU01_27420 [Tenuibacillus multivorans]
MRNLLSIILLGIVLLTGCDSDSSLSFSEESEDQLNKDVQSFFHGVKNDNGVHLYFDNHNKAIHVYLNGSNVVQDEKVNYFTDFDVEADGETLRLIYESDEAIDYSDQSLKHERFYKVNVDNSYETIRIFHNGEESHFGTISGNS